MSTQSSRRDFLARTAVCAVATTIPGLPAWARAVEASPLKFGYTSMTWGNEERQSIEDISSLGFPGIQMRNNAVAEFRPEELRDLLQQNKLKLVALSSGELNIDPAVEADQLAMHVANARFVQQVGGSYLQVLDQLKPYPRKVAPGECVRLGKLLTELGKRTSDLGVPLGYHNHMNTISEHPDDLQRVLDVADPRFVHLELDTAHFVAGGGDPAKAIVQYRDRMLFLHAKDLVDISMDTGKAKYPFQFVELGKGRVDLPSVFGALKKTGFSGWVVVELDRVPDKSHTPKECAAISKAYLEQTIGIPV